MGHMQAYMCARAGRSEYCKFLSREGPEVSHRARGRAVDGPDLLQHRALSVTAAKLHDIGLSDRRRRQSQKLDRPTRCFHPRDRRRDARLRSYFRGVSWPAHVSSFGARGVASVANPLRPRQCAARRRNIARAARTRTLGHGRRRPLRARSPMAWSATATNVTAVDRRRAPRRLRRRRFLGTDAFPQGAQPHPRSPRVLHPGLERGGAGAARLLRRDGAVRSAGGRVSRVLCRLFGYAGAGGRGARAMLEVRSREVPFILEHGGTKAIRRLTVRHHSRCDRRARTQNRTRRRQRRWRRQRRQRR